MMNKPVTVACVQAAPVFMDLGATVDKTVAYIDEAAQKGAELIAFPETWIPGYPWFLWLNSPATNMPLVYQYHLNSLVLDSVQARRIADAAARNNISVVVGFSERDHGSLYISQWLIGDDGETIGIRRKLKATHVERTLFGESDGSSLTTWDTPLGNVGALCCWEHLQPLSRYAMYSQHEEIHIAAWPSFSLYNHATTALGPEVNTAASRLYAAEGQCFVIAPCAVVSNDMIDFLCPDDDRRALLSPGGGHARIYGPDGRELIAPLEENEEGLLIATLDPAAITFAKLAADPVGHYSRPDVTRLLFNPSANMPVVRQSAPPETPEVKASDEAEEERWNLPFRSI